MAGTTATAAAIITATEDGEESVHNTTVEEEDDGMLETQSPQGVTAVHIVKRKDRMIQEDTKSIPAGMDYRDRTTSETMPEETACCNANGVNNTVRELDLAHVQSHSGSNPQGIVSVTIKTRERNMRPLTQETTSYSHISSNHNDELDTVNRTNNQEPHQANHHNDELDTVNRTNNQEPHQANHSNNQSATANSNKQGSSHLQTRPFTSSTLSTSSASSTGATSSPMHDITISMDLLRELSSSSPSAPRRLIHYTGEEQRMARSSFRCSGSDTSPHSRPRTTGSTAGSSTGSGGLGGGAGSTYSSFAEFSRLNLYERQLLPGSRSYSDSVAGIPGSAGAGGYQKDLSGRRLHHRLHGFRPNTSPREKLTDHVEPVFLTTYTPPVGSIGAEIRRLPKLKFQRKKLPDIGAKPCQLFNKTNSAAAAKSGTKDDGGDTVERTQNAEKTKEKKEQQDTQQTEQQQIPTHTRRLVISLPKDRGTEPEIKDSTDGSRGVMKSSTHSRQRGESFRRPGSLVFPQSQNRTLIQHRIMTFPGRDGI